MQNRRSPSRQRHPRVRRNFSVAGQRCFSRPPQERRASRPVHPFRTHLDASAEHQERCSPLARRCVCLPPVSHRRRRRRFARRRRPSCRHRAPSRWDPSLGFSRASPTAIGLATPSMTLTTSSRSLPRPADCEGRRRRPLPLRGDRCAGAYRRSPDSSLDAIFRVSGSDGVNRRAREVPAWASWIGADPHPAARVPSRSSHDPSRAIPRG